MPIYEYKCKSCGEISESIMATWGDKLVICPKCRKGSCELVVSAHAGYNIKGNNSASERPKNAGSFKRGKR